MPIYTYRCGDCGIVKDYLLARWGEKPARCMVCDSNNLEREWSGQTFACSKGSVRVDSAGNASQKPAAETRADTPSGLEPGIHITAGVTRDKRLALNFSRVQPDGRVDASVTGYKKP